MKTIFVMSLLLSTGLLWAKGPMSHERTQTPKMSNATSGRFLYVGDVPKFEGNELEITISKLNLTTRVTANVSQGRINTYAHQLFKRWKTVSDASMDRIFNFHPLVRIGTLADGKPANVRAWAKIAEQYSSHILEKSGMDIYREKRHSKNFDSYSDQDDYNKMISEAYFKYLFDTRDSSDEVFNDNRKFERLLSEKNSERLFKKHLGHLFTPTREKAGYVGFLTLVYPIAATVAGPFDQPKEMVTDLKTAQSIEARWWSDKWNDEFGGFPFLLIEWSGVAFHGPITNYNPLDVWYLRRGYVSHGCHRMDGSDLLELRALMPQDLNQAAKQIKVTVLDYFDVVDLNRDGKEEAVDVKYYNIPTSVTVAKGKTIDEAISPFLIRNQTGSFINNNQYAKKFYDASTDTLRNIPRYNVGAKTLDKEGTHERVSIKRFDYRPTRIIQYTEEGHGLKGYDDVAGKYPPKYFQRH